MRHKWLMQSATLTVILEEIIRGYCDTAVLVLEICTELLILHSFHADSFTVSTKTVRE